MYKIVFVDYNEDRRTTIRMLFNEAKSLQMNTYSYMDKVDFDDNVVLLSWHISNTETRDNDQCEFAKLAEGSAGCYFIQHSGALSASTMNHDTKTGTCSLEDIQSLFKHLAQKDCLVTKESIFQTIEEFFIDRYTLINHLLPLDILVQGALLAGERTLPKPVGTDLFEIEYPELNLLFDGELTSSAFAYRNLKNMGSLKPGLLNLLFPSGVPGQLLTLAFAVHQQDKQMIKSYLNSPENLKSAHDEFKRLTEHLCEPKK
jgi:hypothetical protein